MTVKVVRDQSLPMRHVLHVRNHIVSVDGTIEEGGNDAGPSPHDLYDAAVSACKALTVVWYARRKGRLRWRIRSVTSWMRGCRLIGVGWTAKGRVCAAGRGQGVVGVHAAARAGLRLAGAGQACVRPARGFQADVAADAWRTTENPSTFYLLRRQ